MEAEADVERLKQELAAWDYGTRAKREQERAEKAEAEVERLKSDKTHLITQCANLLEALVPSDKSPSTEWHRKQALNKKAYLK
jgi:ribosome-binding ATPase YchF (GTP1/OBG family)